jgi:hypothetical protein
LSDKTRSPAKTVEVINKAAHRNSTIPIFLAIAGNSDWSVTATLRGILGRMVSAVNNQKQNHRLTGLRAEDTNEMMEWKIRDE